MGQGRAAERPDQAGPGGHHGLEGGGGVSRVGVVVCGPPLAAVVATMPGRAARPVVSRRRPAKSALAIT